MSEGELRIMCVAFYSGIIDSRDLEAHLHYYFLQHPASAEERDAAGRSYKRAEPQRR